MRFEIFKRMTLFGYRYFWRLKSANGEIIAVGGEGFHNRGDVVDILKTIAADAELAPVRDV